MQVEREVNGLGMQLSGLVHRGARTESEGKSLYNFMGGQTVPLSTATNEVARRESDVANGIFIFLAVNWSSRGFACVLEK